jgi:GNAT superfamily N-acetyltransferase
LTIRMTDLVVRRAGSQDVEALARLCSQLGYPATADAMPGRMARFAADPGAREFVATRANQVVGFTTVHLRQTLNHDAPIAQITLLVVDESNRTRGVGRALVDAAVAWAEERGAKRVAVTTALDRAGAHAFYEKVGFRHTGRRYAKDLP